MASIVRWLFKRRRVTVGSSSSSTFFPSKLVDNFIVSQNSTSDGDSSSSRATDNPPPPPPPSNTILDRFSSSQPPIDMSSLSSPTTSPWLMLPPSGDNKVYKFYSPAENIAINKACGGDDDPIANYEHEEPRIAGSSHGWLAVFYRYRQNNDLFLSDPITGKPPVKLPSLNTLTAVLANRNRMVYKLTLSSSPLQQDSCRALMSFGSEGRLAFCCPGRSTEWTPFGDICDESGALARSYKDFVYSSTHKLFLCIMRYERYYEAPDPRYHRKREDLPGLCGYRVEIPLVADLEAWDLSDPRSPRIDWAVKDISLLLSERDHCLVKPGEPCLHDSYLVLAEPYSEEMYFVTRHVHLRMRSDGSFARFLYYDKYRGSDDSYPYKTVGFDVYKIDRDGGKMVYMDGHLDDMVMFIGSADSFAMPASMFPRLKANSIYFTDVNILVPLRHARSHYGGHDNGVFDYGSKTFYPCGPFPCDYQSIRRTVPAPLWFSTSDITLKSLG